MQDYVSQAVLTELTATVAQEDSRAIHALLGLITELGELADPFKRHIFYGQPLDRTLVSEEMGDMLWYLALLCDQFNLNFEGLMEDNIAKLRRQYPNKFTEHDAVVRADKSPF